MTGTRSARRVFLTLALFVAAALTGLAAPVIKGYSSTSGSERRSLARALLTESGIDVLNYHVSGMRDRATALHNLQQTAEGRPARRSYYGNAPGGTTVLDLRMLRALLTLVAEGHRFRITELAGGSHSSRSRHYAGVAFDIDFLDGRKIRPGHPTYRRFMQRCRELGATEVIGPGSRGHNSHVHIAWPRS